MCFMLYTLKTTVCHIPMTVHPLLPFVEELEASSLSRQLQQLQAQVEDTADTGKAFSVD